MDEWLARYTGDVMTDKSYVVKFINGKRCIIDEDDILIPWTKEYCKDIILKAKTDGVDMLLHFNSINNQLANTKSVARQGWLTENLETLTKVFDEIEKEKPPVTYKSRLNLFGG